MLDMNEEDGRSKESILHPTWTSRHEASVANAQKELGINTLENFPTARMCEALMGKLPFMNDIWVSQVMLRHCLTQIWSEYGVHLGERRCRASVSQMASDLTENTRPAIRPDENAHWHNWFSGPRLRWEMIGMVFTFAGFASKHFQEWDSFFHLPELQGMNRTTAADKMRACASACIQLCTDSETNDLLVVLMRNVSRLQSMLVSDESDKIRTESGMVVSSAITAGLHRLPIYKEITPSTQYRTGLSASLYCLDKCDSLFTGRPPMFTHHYCTYQLPLDLSEEETFSGPGIFAEAKSKLDSNGWNTSGKIYPITWVRALTLQSPIREGILELSLGVNTQFTKAQIDNLTTRLSEMHASYPPHLHYHHPKPGQQMQNSRQPREFYIVTRIHLDILNCRFLLQRLAVSRSFATGQELFDIALEIMTVVLSLWLNRDQLQNWNFAFDWIVVCYGIPSAGVISLELLNSINPTLAAQRKEKDKTKFSRSSVIQTLTMFVAFLSWIRPTDGNVALCWRLKRVMQRIVDSVLDTPSLFPSESGVGNDEVVTDASGGVDGREEVVGGEEWSDIGDAPLLSVQSDDLNWLNTVDWTRGDWLDVNLPNLM
ncbi:hypothetical protein B7494_g4354 [Chlorociboria aeruginascens]|nr:hypothetical protein B7494_g4354 [Chlorociboria aeruginascens]